MTLHKIRYGMPFIDAGINLGNRLIEYALRTMLNLPQPNVGCNSMFRPIADDVAALYNSDCEFVLLPGSTILADGPGQSEAMHSLHKIKVPIYCTAASGWGPGIPYHGREVLDRITPPIGARDPHTLAYLEGLGIPAILVGCPTAYMPLHTTEKTNVILGYGRSCVPWQQELFDGIARNAWFNNSRAYVAVQEMAFDGRYAKEAKLDFFTYDNPSNVYAEFAKAELVVTGRLHGLLPAMSQRCRVAFFGDKADSRFSLLEYLGVPMTEYGKEPWAVTLRSYMPRLSELQKNFFAWKDQTIGTHLHP